MLMVEFKEKDRMVRAIILDKPSAGSVSGVVECCTCSWRSYIVSEDAIEQANEIERFALEHKCGFAPKSHTITVHSIDELKDLMDSKTKKEGK